MEAKNFSITRQMVSDAPAPNLVIFIESMVIGEALTIREAACEMVDISLLARGVFITSTSHGLYLLNYGCVCRVEASDRCRLLLMLVRDISFQLR